MSTSTGDDAPAAVSLARPGAYPEGWGGEVKERSRPAGYKDPEDHLRDELWRLWLRVEYEVRRRWERGGLPRVNDEGGLGVWGPGDMAGLFRFAHAELGGEAVISCDHGSRTVLESYLEHSAQLERRVAASLAAGLRLPLIEIAYAFGLDARQHAALTCALLPELDPHLISAYRYLSHDPSCRGIDGRLLALLVYDSPGSRSRLARDLSADSPLLFYRLLEPDESPQRHDTVLSRRLRPAARLLSLLAGDPVDLDPQFSHLAQLPGPPPPGRFPEQAVAQVARALESAETMLVLRGQRGVGKRLLLHIAAARLQRRLLLIDGRQLLRMRDAELRMLLRGLLREVRLLGAIPVVPDLDDVILAAGERDELPDFMYALCADHKGPLAVTFARERLPVLDLRPVLRIEMGLPSLHDRVALWCHHVPALTPQEAAPLAERFAVTGGTIALAARAAAAACPPDSAPTVADLDLSVRDQLHDRIGRLGRRLPTPYSFDDLVVDEDIYEGLQEILSCVAERRRVREEWGFRGAQGVSVLLSGEPGVGKTMSATVLARALSLAIYEIDLSRVVSKWVGETEKNLAEVFDAAEPGHIVLLFNEADSLFGKRTTDVKTANDRYANLETNYLLQRLERFSGLAILTTNLGQAIDPAFRRRFAYDVQVPFPSEALRAELWRRAIPDQAWQTDLEFEQLGRRFELSGGFIKVAAERTAFVAAALKEPIGMDLIAATVERMYRERGKLMPIGKLE